MNHYLMVAYPGCHDVIPLSVATGKKLPLFLDLTHVSPYSVKYNSWLDNSRCFSELLESNFCSLRWISILVIIMQTYANFTENFLVFLGCA